MKTNQMNLKEEAARCLLCENAPCSRACGKGDVARAIRAVRFGNEGIARQWLEGCDEGDLEKAEQACIHYDRPIRIREILSQLPEAPRADLPSLAIDFCGIPCENPFFLASSSICTNYEMVARAFDAGWAGVFYKTICLDDINEVSPRFDVLHREGDKGDFTALRNMEQLSENPVEVDFDILSRLKKDYPNKIVVASIMGSTEEQWIELAKMAEAAGVDAVELNFSCPQMRLAGMGSDVGQDPELVTFYTAYVKHSVSIPVIPKMTPNITMMSNPAMGSYFAGADAISAINTIKSVTMDERAEVSGQWTVSGLWTRRQTHRPALYPRDVPESCDEEPAPERHWWHRDVARRPPVHPAGMQQRAGVHRRHAIWLPHHRRPHPGTTTLHGQPWHFQVVNARG